MKDARNPNSRLGRKFFKAENPIINAVEAWMIIIPAIANGSRSIPFL